MAPRKQKQKMSLNEFLGDSALGSWADEMESLPSAPATRNDEDHSHDRYNRRDDFLSSKPDRALSGAPREDLPLPSQPPYTAFIGNLSFELTEEQLGDFFGSNKTKSIKIIKDREEKPKGFGYIEFTDLEGLKEALSKSGSSFSGRTIRVSVAEPPKERGTFAGGLEDEAKFDNPWRRDGPLPELSDSRETSARRHDGASSIDRLPGVAEGAGDWRASRAAVTRSAAPESDGPAFRRKGSGFSSEGLADKEVVWSIGAKFTPSSGGSAEDNAGAKFGSMRGRGDMAPPKDGPPAIDEGDWRSSSRQRPGPQTNTSPSNSMPPTPQISRRKLELLPRSDSASASPSPLSSPRVAATSITPNSRSNPFGAAKPVDVSSKEQAVAERLAREREANHPMSRTSSRAASERSPGLRARSPPPSPKSPKLHSSISSSVRPSLSFANVAGSKKDDETDQSPVDVGKETTALEV